MIEFGMKLVFTFRSLILIEKTLEEKSLKLYFMNLKNQIIIYAYSLESQISIKKTHTQPQEFLRSRDYLFNAYLNALGFAFIILNV